MIERRKYLRLNILGLLLILTLYLSFAFPTLAGESAGLGTVLHNANLRHGPGLAYAIVGGALKGEQLVIIGCDATCDWYELTDGKWIAAFLVDLAATIPPLAGTIPDDATIPDANSTIPELPAPITVVGWNTQLSDAAITRITDRIAAFTEINLWGLTAVNQLTYQYDLEAAAEAGEMADFGSVMGRSGGGERIVALYDTSRFDMIDSWEQDLLDTAAGNARAALVLHLRDKPTDIQLLFMVNHLERDLPELRQQQAQALNAWAARQVLPVIAVGDYNVDWAVADEVHDPAYDTLVADERFQWIRPAELLTTECNGWPCEMRVVQDFVFTVGAAQSWLAASIIATTPDDFPDDETTSNHRPVVASLWPEQVPPPPLVNPPRPTETPTPTTPYVIAAGDIRSGPGTTYPITGQAYRGQRLRIIARNRSGDWYQLSNGNWLPAYLMAGVPPFLNVPRLPATPTPYFVARTPAPPFFIPPVVPPQRDLACDPAYPTVCIPPSPPFLQCDAIPYHDFPVIGDDPHGFDEDENGVGCEG